MRAILAFSLSLFLLTLGSSEARANDRLTVTREEGSADCPDAQALVARTAAMPSPVALSAAGAEEPMDKTTRRVRVRFFRGLGSARAERTYRADVEVGGERAGVRALSDASPTCGPLTEAVLVTLTLMLDPDAEVPLRAPTPRIASAPEKQVSPSSPKRDPILGFDVGFGAAFAVIGPVAPELVSEFHVRPVRWLALGIGGFLIPPQRVSINNPQAAIVVQTTASSASTLISAGTDVGLFGALGEACAIPWGDGPRWDIETCLGSSVGSVRHNGFAGNLLVSVQASALFRRSLIGPLGVWGRTGLEVPLNADRNKVEGPGGDFKVAPVGGFLLFGASVQLW